MSTWKTANPLPETGPTVLYGFWLYKSPPIRLSTAQTHTKNIYPTTIPYHWVVTSFDDFNAYLLIVNNVLKYKWVFLTSGKEPLSPPSEHSWLNLVILTEVSSVLIKVENLSGEKSFKKWSLRTLSNMWLKIRAQTIHGKCTSGKDQWYSGHHCQYRSM